MTTVFSRFFIQASLSSLILSSCLQASNEKNDEAPVATALPSEQAEAVQTPEAGSAAEDSSTEENTTLTPEAPQPEASPAPADNMPAPQPEPATPDEEVKPVTETPKLGFALIAEKVLNTYCVDCHGYSGGYVGDLNLENYTTTKAAIDDIKRLAIDRRRMPPKTSTSKAGLPDEPYELLKKWIEAGAPE